MSAPAMTKTRWPKLPVEVASENDPFPFRTCCPVPVSSCGLRTCPSLVFFSPSSHSPETFSHWRSGAILFLYPIHITAASLAYQYRATPSQGYPALAFHITYLYAVDLPGCAIFTISICHGNHVIPNLLLIVDLLPHTVKPSPTCPCLAVLTRRRRRPYMTSSRWTCLPGPLRPSLNQRRGR